MVAFPLGKARLLQFLSRLWVPARASTLLVPPLIPRSACLFLAHRWRASCTFLVSCWTPQGRFHSWMGEEDKSMNHLLPPSLPMVPFSPFLLVTPPKPSALKQSFPGGLSRQCELGFQRASPTKGWHHPAVKGYVYFWV